MNNVGAEPPHNRNILTRRHLAFHTCPIFILFQLFANIVRIVSTSFEGHITFAKVAGISAAIDFVYCILVQYHSWRILKEKREKKDKDEQELKHKISNPIVTEIPEWLWRIHWSFIAYVVAKIFFFHYCMVLPEYGTNLMNAIGKYVYIYIYI